MQFVLVGERNRHGGARWPPRERKWRGGPITALLDSESGGSNTSSRNWLSAPFVTKNRLPVEEPHVRHAASGIGMARSVDVGTCTLGQVPEKEVAQG